MLLCGTEFPLKLKGIVNKSCVRPSFLYKSEISIDHFIF